MSKCPICSAPVLVEGVFPGGSVRCRGCGATFAVARVPEDETPSFPTLDPTAAPGDRCPRCSLPLEPRETEGHFVDVCPDWHGVFVAHDVLTRMRAEGPPAVADLALAPAPEAEARYVDCPRCHAPMARRPFTRGSRIMVDRCAAHGTWFDGVELREGLASSMPDGGPEPGDEIAKERAKLEVALALEADHDAREVAYVTEGLAGRLYTLVTGRRSAFRRW